MKKFIILSLIGLIALGSYAQNRVSGFADTKAEHWTVRKFISDPLNTRHYTFENGLTLITSTNSATSRVYTMVAVKTGSKNDPSTNTGLAHYLEHMLFKGTDKYGTSDWAKEEPLLKEIDNLYERYNSTKDENARKFIYSQIDSVSQLAAKYSIANEFDKMCQAMGAKGTNAFTSNDMTVYINDIPSNGISQWLAFESERYRNPVFRLFHTELEAVYEEKNISVDRDMSQVWEQLFAEIFKKHNYGKQTTIGTIEHLKNPSLKAIREYYNTYYVPNNMAIIMSGDFNPDSVAMQVYEGFKYMKAKPVPQYQFEEEEYRNAERTIEVFGPSSEVMVVGYPLPGASSKQARIGKIVNLLLNNSQAGLLDLNLVKQQKVLNAGTSLETMKDYSLFLVMGSPKEGQQLDSMKNLLMDEISKIGNGEFDEEMLKAIILNQDISKLEEYKENSARCYFLMESFVNEIDYQQSANELFEMSKITKAEIMDFVNEYLGKNRIVVYKRKGETPKREKIEKPLIHPVELNRDKQSDFVKNWLSKPASKMQPVYFNPSSVAKHKIGKTRLYHVKNTENRLFKLEIRFDYGTRHDLKTDILTDFLYLVSTKNKSQEQISKQLFSLGCSFSTFTTPEYTSIVLQGPEENYQKGFDIINEIMLNAVFEKEVLDELKLTTLKNRENSKTSAQAINGALNNYMKYGKLNPTTAILSNTALKGLTVADIEKTKNVLLMSPRRYLYYGTLDASNVTNSLKNSVFFAKKIKSTKDEISPKIKEQTYTTPTVFFVDYPQVQASVRWYSKDEMYNPNYRATITAFNQYFGGDMSSVVFQTIRESKALAYSTSAYFISPDKPTKPYLFTAFVGTQSDKFHDAISSMNELIQDLPKNEQVFELAKSSVVSSIETERVTEDSYIPMLLTMERMQQTKDPKEQTYSDIQKLTFDNIAEFHKKHIAGKVNCLSVVASKDRLDLEKDLKKYGDVKVLSLEDIFGY
jgi:predicted Zn-dependent peptidase